jgi:hypothetical protein
VSNFIYTGTSKYGTKGSSNHWLTCSCSPNNKHIETCSGGDSKAPSVHPPLAPIYDSYQNFEPRTTVTKQYHFIFRISSTFLFLVNFHPSSQYSINIAYSAHISLYSGLTLFSICYVNVFEITKN